MSELYRAELKPTIEHGAAQIKSLCLIGALETLICVIRVNPRPILSLMKALELILPAALH